MPPPFCAPTILTHPYQAPIHWALSAPIPEEDHFVDGGLDEGGGVAPLHCGGAVGPHRRGHAKDHDHGDLDDVPAVVEYVMGVLLRVAREPRGDVIRQEELDCHQDPLIADLVLHALRGDDTITIGKGIVNRPPNLAMEVKDRASTLVRHISLK